MPILPNPKHEAFAQARAGGASIDDAYSQAGFKAHRGNAHRLSTNESVRDRVTELQRRTAEKSTWSATERMKSLQAIHDAQIDKDPRVAISAIAEANKMDGSHKPTKHQHSGPNGGPIPVVDLSKASDEQLDALEALFGPLALAGGDDEGDPAGEDEENS